MTTVIRQEHIQEPNQVSIFYAERILELIDSGFITLARSKYLKHQHQLSKILKQEHLDHLNQSTSKKIAWSSSLETETWQRMQNAWTFGEYKTVHDCGHEILMYQPNDDNTKETFYQDVLDLLAANNAHYIEPDEVSMNTFIDAKVEFIVEKRQPRNPQNNTLQGNPGFYLKDAANQHYRCFIKQLHNVQIDDHVRLKITNIPGLVLSTNNSQETILYLEPRVTPGETIEVELASLSHTGNSFTFRYHSYDGFLWFKRRGVNKEIFNQSTLRPGDRITAKVLYTSEEEKRSSNGNITRLGIIKAIPLRRAGSEPHQEDNPNTNAAKALN